MDVQTPVVKLLYYFVQNRWDCIVTQSHAEIVPCVCCTIMQIDGLECAPKTSWRKLVVNAFVHDCAVQTPVLGGMEGVFNHSRGVCDTGKCVAFAHCEEFGRKLLQKTGATNWQQGR